MSDYSSISFKNNGKLKLLIIVGTRPEIIRLAAVINKTRKTLYLWDGKELKRITPPRFRVMEV